MRDRMTKGGTGEDEIPDENAERKRAPQPSTSRRDRDDAELKKAMDASKATFEKEARKTAE